MTKTGKIMIVDDEFLTAMALADLLSEHGHAIVGPFTNVDEAIEGLKDQPVDGAFLDVNLGNGQTSAEIADALEAQRTPFTFLTGYSDLPDGMRHFETATYLTKPVSQEQALKQAKRMIEQD